jgi:hypothetical protein
MYRVFTWTWFSWSLLVLLYRIEVYLVSCCISCRLQQTPTNRDPYLVNHERGCFSPLLTRSRQPEQVRRSTNSSLPYVFVACDPEFEGGNTLRKREKKTKFVNSFLV